MRSLQPSASIADVVGAQQTASFQDREGHDYFVRRGNEETSNCLAVRTAVADGMALLLWHREHEGNYKSRNHKEKRLKAYTRTLMAKIMLKITFDTWAKCCG